MLLINGEKTTNLDFSDRGFQYGDGLFETIEVLNSHPIFQKLHLERLMRGCKTLKIPFVDFDLLESEIKTITQNQSRAVLKIIITRGSGGRGYQQPDPILPSRIVALYPFPEYPVSFKSEGVKLRFCTYRLGINPNLAGIKHLNRLDQVLARSEWQATYQEGLMLDLNDNVIEGTMCNLFVIKNNYLYTPKLDLCGIKGIIRQLVFQAAEQLALKIIETNLSKQQCLEADELFLTNSIICLWPVRQLLKQKYNVGAITQQIQSWLEEYRTKDICHL